MSRIVTLTYLPTRIVPDHPVIFCLSYTAAVWVSSITDWCHIAKSQLHKSAIGRRKLRGIAHYEWVTIALRQLVRIITI